MPQSAARTRAENIPSSVTNSVTITGLFIARRSLPSVRLIIMKGRRNMTPANTYVETRRA